MRSSVLVSILFLLSCSISAPPTLDQHSTGDAALPQIQKAAARPVYSNAEIWKTVLSPADSASLFFWLNDSTRISLTLSGKLDTKDFLLKSIHLTSTAFSQTLRQQNGSFVWRDEETYPFLKFEDVNFDGYRDLQVFDNAGGTGNAWYRVWLYQPKEKRFSLSKEFTETPSLEIDSVRKEVLSYFRLGDCEETIGYYKVSNNRLQPTKYLFTKFDDRCITYQKTLTGTRWDTVKLGEGDISFYDSVYH